MALDYNKLSSRSQGIVRMLANGMSYTANRQNNTNLIKLQRDGWIKYSGDGMWTITEAGELAYSAAGRPRY